MIAAGNGQQVDPVIERVLELDSAYYQARQSRDHESASTYTSGEISRMNPVPRGIDPLGSDADYHYRTEHNYFLHVERGRAAVRNHPLVEQGINRLIANLRLDGFTLDVNSGDQAVDQALKDDWKEWSGETMAGRSLCDYEGTRTFQQIARQSFFSRCSDGDIIHLPTDDGRLQTWESHHCRNPFGRRSVSNSDQDGWVHGAEVRRGRTVAYWLTPYNLKFNQSLTRYGQSRRFPVFDSQGNKITFWLGFRHRFMQRRGISRLSAPRDAMTGFEDLNYANIKSALRRSLIAYLMQDSATAGPNNRWDKSKLPEAGDRYAKEVGLGIQAITVEQSGEPAQVFNVPAGKTIEGWTANMPPASFFEHSALLLTMLAVNLDLPLSFLLLDGSLVNFHGGRMTFDQVKLRLRQLQRDEIQGLWGPTYEWRIRAKLNPSSRFYDRELARAYQSGQVDPFSYVFRPQGHPYVKPAEDVAAETAAVAGRVKSERAVLAERGVDLDDHRLEVITDEASWIRLSMETAYRMQQEFQRKYGITIDIESYAAKLRKDQEWKAAAVQKIADQQENQAQMEAAAGGR